MTFRVIFLALMLGIGQIALVITSPPPPNAVAGVSYLMSFSALGGCGKYRWDVVPLNGQSRLFKTVGRYRELPAGMVIDHETGQLFGTPPRYSEGEYSFVVAAQDHNSCVGLPNRVEMPFTVVIKPRLAEKELKAQRQIHSKTIKGEYKVDDICITWFTKTGETTCIVPPKGAVGVRIYTDKFD